MRVVSLVLLATLFRLSSAVASEAGTPTVDDITFARTFLLADVSGTAANPGETPHHAHLFSRGAWTLFDEGTIFAANVTQSGPSTQERSLFSTNWLAAGAQRELGSRGLVLFRARISLEPLTVPNDGYPMLLQSVPGTPIDHQPGQELVGEVAVHLAWRFGTTSFAHLYLAPVGDPAFGAVPSAQRASSEEIVEAPFSWNPQEIAHRQTSVATAGFATRFLRIEGSSFHAKLPGASGGSDGFGSQDSWSARLSATPARNWSAQVSTARFGKGVSVRNDSASLSYGRDTGPGAFATSVIWSRASPFSSVGAEATLRASRNIFVLRLESVDRDPSLFLAGAAPGVRKMGHATIGYTRDIVTRRGYRTGIGADLDYHSDVHSLNARYGHKPQSIFLFVRARTDARDERGR